MQLICTSALGSVKGKKLGKKRVFTLEPKSSFMAWSSVPFRSEKVMLVSTHRPSTWWKTGEWVASAASLRCTLPGTTMRIGGGLGDHGANLHRRGVGAHQQPVARGLCLLIGEHQRVLRVARGVVGREVQRLEVVEIALHLRAQRGGVAEMMEDRDDLVHRLQQRVLDAGRAHAAGQRDVDARPSRMRLAELR